MPKHEVPYRLIEYVAKTGFITKDLWRKYFYTGETERWCHQSWLNLHKYEYLKSHPESALNEVSVLNLKNPKMKIWLCDKPVKHVYAGHISHDLQLYEGLLKLEKSKAIEDWETEAQLKRRLGIHFYYNGFSGESVKYPDALVHVPQAGLPWAVEMETTVKNKQRYERALDAYSSRKDIGGVLVVHRQKAVMDAMQRAITKTYYGGPKIYYMDLQVWKESPETFPNYVKRLCTPPAPSAG